MAVARKFEDLIIWQLASQFETWAYKVSDEGSMRGDADFRQQWRDAASSPARNISEGFIKYDPPEFARYVNIAKGSLGELQNQMIKGKPRGFFTEEEYLSGWRLLCRTIKATNRFHAYLRSCGRKGPKSTKQSGPAGEPERCTDAVARNLAEPNPPKTEEPSRNRRPSGKRRAQVRTEDPGSTEEPGRTEPSRTPQNRTKQNPADRTKQNPAEPNQAEPRRPNQAEPRRTEPSRTP